MALRRRLRDLRTRYEESTASRRGLFDLRTRSEESASTCCGECSASAQQQMLRAHVALLTRSRRADAGHGAPTLTMRPPNVMRRERGEPERCCGENVASVQQSTRVAARRCGLFGLQTRCEESAASPNDVAVRMLRACNDTCFMHVLLC